MGIIIFKMEKYIFIVELFYFVYIIIKNVHLKYIEIHDLQISLPLNVSFKLSNFHSLCSQFL